MKSFRWTRWNTTSRYRGKILAIGSEGGGIYIYEALVASARMISSAKAQTKHIILFSDAADAEQSAHYEEIVDKLREAGVTVSVVGLGTEHDCDANLLKDIAYASFPKWPQRTGPR